MQNDGSCGFFDDVISITSYDPAWIDRFCSEQSRLFKALDGIAKEIHHIGSTSLPGIDAKDCIDIMVAVPELAALNTYKSALAAIGYIHEPLHISDEKERYFFRKPDRPAHHVHIVEHNGWHYWRWLLFKEYLLKHPECAETYVALKHKLITQVNGKRDDYTKAKTLFVTDIERKAFGLRPDLYQRFSHLLHS